ncbi:MAG TPA: DinB family protein [Thermoanaerobaculia bacterium]|nr:DinB family protein [Thermoanaerobaculia bacterium]
MPDRTLGSIYLETVTRNFRGLRSWVERAIEQLDDDQLHVAPDPHSNTISVLMNHVAGNMRSRWTDFLVTDGEKPDRRRELEFEKRRESRDELLASWNASWTILLDAIASLREEDLLREVTIRGEPHTVVLAINRSVQHYAYHVGQILYLAKHLAGERWSSLS